MNIANAKNSMVKVRLDKHMTVHGLVRSRSQAESWIKLGKVTVSGKPIVKPGYLVDDADKVTLNTNEQYVSRAGLKLASVADKFAISFEGKIVLDVGSSTGGFTDYSLQHHAAKVIAVDVGTNQLHPSLRDNERIELHEKTDVRDFIPSEAPDIVVIDVSFVSLRNILPAVACMSGEKTRIVAMAKPQFEASREQITRGGIVKNDRIRRDILRELELWLKGKFIIIDKADSGIKGAHGNQERFYHLRLIGE